jgi:cyanamide hydratase family protein with HD domain
MGETHALHTMTKASCTTSFHMKLEDLEIPATPACRAALEVATTYCSPALLNHSVRAYLWAAAYGLEHSINFDAELLYVSAMLHDIALVKEFDNHTLPFEEAGGHLAWVFGAAAGWPVERRRRVAEVIVRHMWDEVGLANDPEGHLLELSTGMDISGRHTEEIPADLRAEVLARYPRLGLGEEFIGHFEDQAERKPLCLAAKFVRNGFTARVAANPLDRVVWHKQS